MSSYKEKTRLKKSDKLTQLVQNFFFKASNIIIQARSHVSPDTPPVSIKLNKWFNLQLNDVLSKEELRLWKLSSSSIVNIATSIDEQQQQQQQLITPPSHTNSILNLPPLVIEIYLDLRHLGPAQTLILNQDHENYNVTQGNIKNEVILERWLLEFDLNTFDLEMDALPSIYKNIMISFRALYTFIRLLPCFKLKQRISKTTLNQSLSIGYRILDGNLPIHSKGRIGLSKNLIDPSLKEQLMTKKFEPIITNVGSLRMSVSYRSNCNFKLNDKEELLSSAFLKLDDIRYKQASSSPSAVVVTEQEEQQEEERSPSIPAASSESPTPQLTQDQSQIQAADNKPPQPQPQPLQIKETNKQLKRLSIQQYNYSLSPGSIFLREISPSQTKLRRSSSSASRIQPFKVGSISSGIPQQVAQTPSQQHSTSPPYPDSLLHHDNNSSSSLAMMLRQQRASFSSQQTTATTTAQQQLKQQPLYVGSIDSSISHNETPRFSSSFGSRYNRRQKSSSGGNSKHQDETEELDFFIKQLDNKPDLRLSISPQESLEKYQIMQKNHNNLSESMNISILQNQNNNSLNSQKELRLINYDQSTNNSNKKLGYHTHHHNESAIADDDDDEIEPLPRQKQTQQHQQQQRRKLSRTNAEEEEDLLFTMSDMNLR